MNALDGVQSDTYIMKTKTQKILEMLISYFQNNLILKALRNMFLNKTMIKEKEKNFC